jgi:hypothetical protein
MAILPASKKNSAIVVLIKLSLRIIAMLPHPSSPDPKPVLAVGAVGVVAVVVVEQAQQTNCHPHTRLTTAQMPEDILGV